MVRLAITAHMICGIIFVSLIIFLLGYYAGYKSVCTEFVEQCAAEALSDQVAAAVYTFYASEEQADSEEDEEEGSGPGEELQETKANEQQEDGQAEERVGQPVQSGSPQLLYEARLAGFGTSVAAGRYVNQLASVDIEAHAVPREARTSRGRKMVWYQVVTAPKPYDVALKVVNFLKKRDKLEGVVLVELPQELQEQRKDV